MGKIMAKTGKGSELECRTPEARLDRIEKALILLGTKLDVSILIGYPDWEESMRDVLNIKENK